MSLVAAYGFNEGSGSTAFDASGNGNNGTIANATWSSAGKYGKALSFNGKNSWVTINDAPSLHLTNGMTLEAWVNPTSRTGWETAILKERTGGLAYSLYATDNSNRPPAAYINTGGSDFSSVGSSALPLSTWTFLAATYDGSSLKLYVNGTLVKSSAKTGNIVTSTGALRIGGNSVWGEFLAGLIDEVRVYNNALSQSAIQTDMNTAIAPAVDTTPPTVTGMMPAANATNVALNTTITATFSESIQPATLLFTVKDAANNPVAGTVLYTDATRSATFTPTSPLAAGTQYIVTIAGAKDLAGNTMTAPATSSFTTAVPDTTPPTVITESPSPGAANVLTTTTVTVTLSEPIQPSTLSFTLRDAKDTSVPGTITYDPTSNTATLTPVSPLAAGITYHVIVSSAADLAGNVMAAEVAWSFSTQSPGTGPFTIWGTTAIPANPSANDPNAVELGVKFQSDVGGLITGIRFYKGTGNTGTHTGELWSSTGQLLASATFGNETATGWQQVTFASPVAIQPLTTYVASYHTTTGHYAGDNNSFTSAGVDNAPLHALSNSAAGGNGVYVYGARAFPTSSYLASNYWVDVVFNSTGVVGPLVTAQTPAQGATNVASSTTVSATFNESVQAASISFVLRNPANNPVAGTSVYNDTTHTVTFTPTAALTAGATYTAVVSGATDAGGTVMPSPAQWSFTVAAPAADPSVVGQWSSVMNWPLVAINQVLLKDGRILMWDGGPTCIGSSSATVYNPATNTFTPVPVPDPNNNNDIFCSGQVVLSDGRVLVVGGHDCSGVNLGTTHLNIFDPTTMTWTRGPEMAYPRWYPTVTLLPDGRALITSGSVKTNSDYVPIPEVYDPVANTVTTLSKANRSVPNYPFVYVLPNGNIVQAGSDEGVTNTAVLNVTTQTWTTVDTQLLNGGSSVMYLPGKILKTGSSYYADTSIYDTNPSVATAYTIDMTQPNPTWQPTASMAYGRAHHNLTILPDGTVFASGGANTLGGYDPSTAILPTEIWSPSTGTWQTVASMATPRMYHSTALLLPDGRILSAGGGRNYVNNADYLSAEIYSPAYLFKGARPTVSSAPSSIGYNASFFVGTPDGASIKSVALIRNGAVTHKINMDQRYIPLTFTQTAGGLTVQAPPDANTAPPGYYMLFIVNSNGVPSVAPIMHVG